MFLILFLLFYYFLFFELFCCVGYWFLFLELSVFVFNCSFRFLVCCSDIFVFFEFFFVFEFRFFLNCWIDFLEGVFLIF